MLNKIFLFIIIIGLTSCGYNPIYSKTSGVDLMIKNFELQGDKNINRKIVAFLNQKNRSRESKYNLKLISRKIITVVAKDKMGNASIYKTAINVSLVVSDGNIKIKEKKFDSNFTYNNKTNKFNLSQYQKNIADNLIDNISEEILIFLSS
jgi:hypothetical protein